jgi:hypothetical protein
MERACKKGLGAKTMKFTMPVDPSEQIQIHNAMVARIGQARQQISANKAHISQDLHLADPGSEDFKKLVQASKNLRMQELCLIDQEKRLRERIDCLRTGNSMDA